MNPVRFFRESVAGGRVKQSPRTLQQELAGGKSFKLLQSLWRLLYSTTRNALPEKLNVIRKFTTVIPARWRSAIVCVLTNVVISLHMHNLHDFWTVSYPRPDPKITYTFLQTVRPLTLSCTTVYFQTPPIFCTALKLECSCQYHGLPPLKLIRFQYLLLTIQQQSTASLHYKYAQSVKFRL